MIDAVANLYRQPSQAVEVMTQAILDDRTGWCHVRMPDLYQGWIKAAQVHLYAEGETSYASAGRVAQVANLFALAYHEPSVTSRAQVLRAKNN